MIRKIKAFTVAFIVWQLVAQYLSSPVFPAPLDCVSSAQESILDGSLLKNSIASLVRVGIGFFLASIVGLSLGALAGISGSFGNSFRDVLEALRPIPPIAWVPLAIVWFGIGNSSAWFVVFIGAFFPIFIQVCHAFANCPQQYLEVSKAYNASPWVTFWWVRLPAAAPEMAQGLRVGLGLAWTSVIAAELVGVHLGLGDRINQLRYVSDYEGMVVCMMTIGFLGWTMSSIANRMEKWLIPWRVSSK